MLGFSGPVLRVAPFAERPCGAGPFVCPLRRGCYGARTRYVVRVCYAGLARYGVRNLMRGAYVMQRGIVMQCPLVVPRGIVAPSFAQNGEFAACSLEAECSRAARTSRAGRVAAANGLRAGCTQACAEPVRKPARRDVGLLLGFPNDEGRSLWTGIGLERFATYLRRYAWA